MTTATAAAEPTPLEQRAAWQVHRTAYTKARGAGCHFSCSHALAFAVAHTGDDPLPKELGQPCATCSKIWEQTKGESRP